jgi:ribosomal protein S18 acetylase RimI-like enzyme
MKSIHDKVIDYRFVTVPTEEQIRQMAEIYQAQGWWQPRDNDRDRLIARLIAGSHCFVVAVDGDAIVGMGRAMSDGISDAYIHDIAVRQNYRNTGIGGNILKTLLDRLRRDGISWIGLIAEPGSISLYRHSGFLEMPGAVPMLRIEES